MKTQIKNSIYIKIFFIGLMVIVSTQSCTDLDEEQVLYDQVISDEFYQTEEEVLSAVGAAYTPMFGFFQNTNMYALNEVPSDEITVPTRGPDWNDGGHWVRLHRHSWNITDPRIQEAWEWIFGCISSCNRLIALLEPLGTDISEAFIQELRALRAINYYWLLDLYGNVPLVTDFEATEPPATRSRAEVYEFVEVELLETIPNLADTGPTDESTYGRVNRWTAYAALVKLYLNAEVYTGTQQWQKAADAAAEIINSGQYTLAPNWRDNFVKENKGASEFIWAVPYDEVFTPGSFHLPVMTLHQQHQNTYNMSVQPWNGFASVAEFYETFIDPVQNPGPQGDVVGLSPTGDLVTGTQDARLESFIVGPQFDSDGVTRLVDGAAEASDPDGPPLTITPYINELLPGGWRQAGARIGKWEFYNGMGQGLSNDFAVFRYSDILLMRAEALWRMDPGNAEALMLVNQIRERAGVDPFDALTEERFLAERGRELFSEVHRRVDQIRFGTFNDEWWEHPADASDHVNIFPVPQSQLLANPNLVQNPGYPDAGGD